MSARAWKRRRAKRKTRGIVPSERGLAVKLYRETAWMFEKYGGKEDAAKFYKFLLLDRDPARIYGIDIQIRIRWMIKRLKGKRPRHHRRPKLDLILGGKEKGPPAPEG